MTNNVCFIKVEYADSRYFGKKMQCLDKSGVLIGGKIYLGDVTSDDHFGSLSESCEKHLHLHSCGVLSLVENHKGMGKGSPTHVGKGSNLHLIGGEESFGFFFRKDVFKGIKEGAKIGVEFFFKRSGEKTEAFASFDNRTAKDESSHFPADEIEESYSHGKIGFPCSGRTYTKNEIVPVNGFYVVGLMSVAWLDFSGFFCDSDPFGEKTGGRERELTLLFDEKFDLSVRDGGVATG